MDSVDTRFWEAIGGDLQVMIDAMQGHYAFMSKTDTRKLTKSMIRTATKTDTIMFLKVSQKKIFTEWPEDVKR